MNKKYLISLLLPLSLATAPMISQAGVEISVNFAPPVMPVYEQPACPGDGYLWTPGYWAWDGADYYWVPGTWVMAPRPGYLWTPGYWGWSAGVFLWHGGYWGEHVGFYGGVNYGFGYTGHGYEGGRWDGDHFSYNRSVNNVNVTNIHNTYNTTVINNVTVNRVSYNGGSNGVNARPTQEEEAVAHESHIEATPDQTRHQETARSNPQLRAAVNHGRPAIAATPRPGAFEDHGAVAAKNVPPPAVHNPSQQAHPQGQQPHPQAQQQESHPQQQAMPHQEMPGSQGQARTPEGPRMQEPQRGQQPGHAQAEPKHESAPHEGEHEGEHERR